jgi:GNAT superfamily N-acetyltransferase
MAAHSAIHDAEAIERVVAALPAPYLEPRGGLWVAWEGAEALGCVALRALAPATAELKRMYVRPEARGRGVARRLSEHAIAVATARGTRGCGSAPCRPWVQRSNSTRVSVSGGSRRTAR